MKKAIFIIFLLLVLLSVVFWVGRQSVTPLIETSEIVRTDTIYCDRPIPIKSTLRPVTISVPRLLFAEAHTTVTSVADIDLVEKESQMASDSVSLNVAIETHTYRDSLLTAQISGPVLGSCRPQLDWYEVYNQTRTVTQTVTKRNRFAVTAGIGAAVTPDGIRPVIGVQIGVVLWSF